jgi:hypothetical protein
MQTRGLVIVDRLRNLAAAKATCLVLSGLVLAASSVEAASEEAFKTASGNIICSLGDVEGVELVCVIKSGLRPAPPKRRACNGGDPVTNRVNLTAAGAAAPVDCAGDPGPLVHEADAKELSYGSAIVKGEIGCVAFKSGLVCVNSKGRGFRLNRESVRYF